METAAYAVGIILGLICSLPIIAVAVTTFVLEGIAFMKFTKEKPVKYWWLVWLPYVCGFGREYVISQLSDESEFRLFGGKLVFKNKLTALWIYLGLYVAQGLLSIIVSCFTWIPVVGMIIAIIHLIIVTPCVVAMNFIEFAYLRDMLNYYKPNCQSNVSTAIWITIVNVFTFGLLRAIYLFNLAKKQAELD